jgi:hypothetical protein
MPSALSQLSMVWAPATVANAAVATSIATLFNFFMVLLLGKKAAATRRVFLRRSGCESSKALLTLCHSLIKPQTRKRVIGITVYKSRG